jgi:hypothetical protein
MHFTVHMIFKDSIKDLSIKDLNGKITSFPILPSYESQVGVDGLTEPYFGGGSQAMPANLAKTIVDNQLYASTFDATGEKTILQDQRYASTFDATGEIFAINHRPEPALDYASTFDATGETFFSPSSRTWNQLRLYAGTFDATGEICSYLRSTFSYLGT